MSGTVTCIGRASAGTAAVARAATGAPATGGAARAASGHPAAATVRQRLPGRTHVGGRLHVGLAGPDSTESPHAVRPVPEDC
ncbi:hypothetical protein ACWEQL_11640 [Kitasatospora sp. NPDC004240]